MSLEGETMWSEDELDCDPVGSVMEVDKSRGTLVGVMRSPGGLVSGEGTSLPVPQLYQVQLACVSKSTGSIVNKSWVLALPIPSCVTLRFTFQFSHL